MGVAHLGELLPLRLSVLEGLISQGATSNMGTLQHCVSGFSILYSKTENGSLQVYPSVCCPV